MARILLIDDEETVLQSVGLLLRSEDHEVVALHDSEQAAELVKNEEYDLIITDIRMAPVDGMEILKIAHDTHPSTPVIVISAFTSDQTVQQSYDLGSMIYIKKPFKVQQVLNAVSNALENK